MSKKVELAALMRFFKIFVNKEWISIEGYDDVLNRFGKLIDVLKEDEIELIIDLTERYYWVSYNEYHTSLRRLLILLLEHSLSNKNRLFIFPIIKPDDEKKIKSGHAIMYMINSIKASISGFDNIEVVLLKEFAELKEENLLLCDEDFMILVDDYIGTGKTLNTTLLEIQKNKTIHNDNYAIFTIAIQDKAIELLKDQNINQYNWVSLPKGISGYYDKPESERRLKTMNGIENRIPKVGKFKLGYEQSEALITLIRTPNNTFPIFWKGIDDKGRQLQAPFQRF